MSRDFKVYLQDIVEAAGRILRYVEEVGDNFTRDDKTMDAIVRNLEVIGEAAKSVSLSVRKAHPDIEWKKLAGLRDILIHEYFGVDAEIICDIVKTKLPELKSRVEKILAKDAEK